MAPLQHVGVIGGGIAGLSCASRLQELGVAVTLYDTGKRGPGGRASSRLWRGQVADHAAQFCEARTPIFTTHMEELLSEGKVHRLAPDALCNLISPGVVEPLADNVPRFVGVGGMGAIADAAVGYLDDVKQDLWVSPNNGIRQDANGKWLVRESKSVERPFDAVVIAHNGKCAERLTSRVPARSTHMLLRTRFAAKVGGGGGGGGRMTLNSMYSLLFEVPTGTLPSTLGACSFVKCEPTLRLLSNNNAKHAAKADAPTEVWTVLSSGAFGAKHKAPQENLPAEVEQEVTALLLNAIDRVAGLPPSTLSKSVTATKLQLWGAAVPLNVWSGGPFTWDAEANIGIAGDWFDQGGEGGGADGGSGAATPSSIESAWLSGRKLAEHIADEERSGVTAGLTLGADGGAFVPTEGGGFGPADGTPQASAWVAPPGGEGGGSPRNSGGGAAAEPTESLFVRNLSYETTEAELSEHLEGAVSASKAAAYTGAAKFGESASSAATATKSVAAVSILVGADGRPRGLARIRMASKEGAKAVVEQLNGKQLGGRSLSIDFDAGGGGAGGKGGGGGGGGKGRGGGRGRGGRGGRRAA